MNRLNTVTWYDEIKKEQKKKKRCKAHPLLCGVPAEVHSSVLLLDQVVPRLSCAAQEGEQSLLWPWKISPQEKGGLDEFALAKETRLKIHYYKKEHSMRIYTICL